MSDDEFQQFLLDDTSDTIGVYFFQLKIKV